MMGVMDDRSYCCTDGVTIGNTKATEISVGLGVCVCASDEDVMGVM